MKVLMDSGSISLASGTIWSPIDTMPILGVNSIVIMGNLGFGTRLLTRMTLQQTTTSMPDHQTVMLLNGNQML